MGGKLLSFARRPWFDPASAADRRLFFLEPDTGVTEVEDLRQLAAAQTGEHAPYDRFVILQHPGEDLNGFRWILYPKFAAQLARVLGEGPARSLALLLGSPGEGSLLALADGLPPGRRFDTLVLAWWFTGDDIADCSGIEEELALVVERLGVRKLALLTNNFRASHDTAIAKGLADNTSLVAFQACAKDDARQWPRRPSPALDALTARNAAATAAMAAVPVAGPVP